MSKKNKPIHNQKHLTLSDRTFIEQELVQGSSFKSIADVLGKDPTTISKEVKLHRVLKYSDFAICLFEKVKQRLAYIFIMKHLIAHLIPYNSDEYCIISYFYSQTMI